jgi:hypothetical protein
MNRLWLGADRDQLCLWLERGEEIQTITHRTVVGERNDHRLLADFLRIQNVSWQEIDQAVLLQPPHSKTTVRVNASLLAASAWWHDRPISVINVDALDTIELEQLRSQVATAASFDPEQLTEIA